MSIDRFPKSEGLWFVRKDATLCGWFPAGAIARDVMLGRLDSGSEISRDGRHWIPLNASEDLLPDHLRQPAASHRENDWCAERKQAELRWADQRSGEDRRSGAGTHTTAERRRPVERRGGQQSSSRHAQRTERGTKDVVHDRNSVTIIGLLALLAVAALFAMGTVNPLAVRIQLPEVATQSD